MVYFMEIGYFSRFLTSAVRSEIKCPLIREDSVVRCLIFTFIYLFIYFFTSDLSFSLLFVYYATPVARK